MPFGLENAPAVFQRYIYLAIKPLVDKGSLIMYLDDISIATKDLNPRIAKWALTFENYNYQKGERMTYVDALSRAPVGAVVTTEELECSNPSGTR